MKDNFIKKAIKVYYRDNSEHYILFGPIRGMKVRINHVTKLMSLYSGIERSHQRRLKESLKEGDVVIDVGANWGLHTLYSSRLVGETGQVIAIEPFPLAYTELEWHVMKNKCDNVVVLHCAVGKFNGEIKMVSNIDASQGIVSDRCIVKDDLCDEILVQNKTLDSIVQEMDPGKIDFVKIDVEGAEDYVLQGAEKTIDKFRPKIIIDPHTPENDLFIGKWFSERGYKVERVDRSLPPIISIDKGWPDKEGIWGSLLAIPF
jgi:FkbM family methyltransferase